MSDISITWHWKFRPFRATCAYGTDATGIDAYQLSVDGWTPRGARRLLERLAAAFAQRMEGVEQLRKLPYRLFDRSPAGDIRRLPAPPAQDQIDILTAVARLEQIGEQRDDEVMVDLLLDRLVTCDAPRLRALLTAETLEWEREAMRP